MATKTYIFNFLLVFSSFTLYAQSDEQLLESWTKKNVQLLFNNNNFITSQWFNQYCISLAKELEFSKIKKCYLIDSQKINAYVFNNGNVFFTSGMVKLINNKHQWAAILAHENAHIVLKHYLKTLKKHTKPDTFFPKKRYKKRLKLNEKEADEWAHLKLLDFKLNPNQIYYFLKRAEESTGKQKNQTHLNTANRINKPSEKEQIDDELINNIHKTLLLEPVKL